MNFAGPHSCLQVGGACDDGGARHPGPAAARRCRSRSGRAACGPGRRRGAGSGRAAGRRGYVAVLAPCSPGRPPSAPASPGDRGLGPANLVTLTRAILVGGVTALVVDRFVIRHQQRPRARRRGHCGPAAGRGRRSGGAPDEHGDRPRGPVRHGDRRVPGPGAQRLRRPDRRAGRPGHRSDALRVRRRERSVAVAAGPLPTRYSAKVVAAIQGIVLVLAASGLVPVHTAAGLVAIALGLLVWSFGHDVGWLWRRRPRVTEDVSPHLAARASGAGIGRSAPRTRPRTDPARLRSADRAGRRSRARRAGPARPAGRRRTGSAAPAAGGGAGRRAAAGAAGTGRDGPGHRRRRGARRADHAHGAGLRLRERAVPAVRPHRGLAPRRLRRPAAHRFARSPGGHRCAGRLPRAGRRPAGRGDARHPPGRRPGAPAPHRRPEGSSACSSRSAWCPSPSVRRSCRAPRSPPRAPRGSSWSVVAAWSPGRASSARSRPRARPTRSAGWTRTSCWPACAARTWWSPSSRATAATR